MEAGEKGKVRALFVPLTSHFLRLAAETECATPRPGLTTTQTGRGVYIMAAQKSKPRTTVAPKTRSKTAPAWAHALQERLLEAYDWRDGQLTVPRNVKPAHKIIAAAVADISMAILQFTIVMERMEDPRGAAVMARMHRDLFLSHKPVRLFRR